MNWIYALLQVQQENIQNIIVLNTIIFRLKTLQNEISSQIVL